MFFCKPRLFVIFISFFALTACVSRKKLRKEFTVATSLTWDQFKGEVPANTKFDAYSFTLGPMMFCDSVNYSAKGKPACKVFFRFAETRSWVNRNSASYQHDSTRLLTHETGHYRISIIWTKQFHDFLNTFKFDTSRFTYQLDSVQFIWLSKVLNRHTLYDNETRHYTNREEQLRWDQMLIDELIFHYRKPRAIRPFKK